MTFQCILFVDKHKAISTYNLLSFFAQLSQSLTAPEHKEAESIPVITNTKTCNFTKLEIICICITFYNAFQI